MCALLRGGFAPRLPSSSPLPPSRPLCNPSCPAPGQAHPCCSPGRLGRTPGLGEERAVVSGWNRELGSGLRQAQLARGLHQHQQILQLDPDADGAQRPSQARALPTAAACPALCPPSPVAGRSPTGPLSIGPVPLCPVSTKPFCVFIEKKCCVLTPCRAFCGPRGLPGHPHSHPCPPGAHP